MTAKTTNPLPLIPTKEEIQANAEVICSHCGDPVGTISGLFALTRSGCGAGIHFRCATVKSADDAGTRNEVWCPKTTSQT